MIDQKPNMREIGVGATAHGTLSGRLALLSITTICCGSILVISGNDLVITGNILVVTDNILIIIPDIQPVPKLLV